MKTDLKDFTIVCITFNNEGLYKTINSILPMLDAGSRMIVQNGGKLVKNTNKNILVFNEDDFGIYDALNKGISRVKTKFFMLLHAGDTFIGQPRDIEIILKELEYNGKDISLNSQYIGSRLHSSYLWRPWMLNFGVQPPHLPVIYRSKTYSPKKYSIHIPVIADFDFFLQQIDWKNAQWNNRILIRMETGGVTSNGFQSFVHVSRCFIDAYGARGIFMALARIPFKIAQALKLKQEDSFD